MWKYKGSRLARTFLTKDKVGCLSDFKIYKATGIKTMGCWCQKRQNNQWSRIESPKKKKGQNTYGQLI